MRIRDSQTTRKLILSAAEQKFAEKGFDRASVSEIAKAAGVNPALIYYYFENKQAMMDELFDDFINEANSNLIEIAKSKYSYGSIEMEKRMEKYKEYIMSHDKTLRLLMTESLKCDGRRPPLFSLIDPGMESMEEKSIMDDMNTRGFNFDTDPNQRRVTEFFTGIMPLVIFSLFKEEWCRSFNLSAEQLMEYFNKANDMTHDHHHRTEK